MGPVVKHRHGGIDWDDAPCPICKAQEEVVLESRRKLAAQQRYESALRKLAELEAENAKLRSLCAAAEWQGIRWRNGQDAEHREWDKTWEALQGGKSDE